MMPIFILNGEKWIAYYSLTEIDTNYGSTIYNGVLECFPLMEFAEEIVY